MIFACQSVEGIFTQLPAAEPGSNDERVSTMMHSAMRRVIPYTLPWNDAPVDISFVFEGEKPAGRHGFLQAKGGRFVFEDGAPGRFWGTNFNSAACFPTHAYSEIVARRLAKFGVNMVRFHQMDAEWSTPNIFQFTKGRRLDNTQSLDPVSMDRLDYLIACLKQEGIYVYLDLLTYRVFSTGDNVDEAEKLGQEARPYSNFDPRLIELQKMYAGQLWTHFNPYTKLAYKDEPAIALSEITNENEILTSFMRANIIEPYRGRLLKRYSEWAAKNNAAAGKEPVDFAADTPEMVAFLVDVQKSYYTEMIRHMRKLGVRIPITGTNWALGGIPLLAAQMATDYTDSHTYWYDWTWKVTEKKFNNRSMLGERDPWFQGLSMFRVLHKPFFVSEWDDPWPNEFRAESSILMAAAAAFQGWSGATIHTYRYDCREGIDMIGAPITADAIGGVPYRGGVFDSFNDPAKFGLFYHAALMARRGDVREPDSAAEIEVPALVKGGRMVCSGDIKALAGAVETCKTGIRLPGEPARAETQAPMDALLAQQPGSTVLRSVTGQLNRDMARRYATIDTPRTKAAYGFLANAGEIALSGLKIKARTDYAVIAISSLTDSDTAHSNNLLLTAIGRADNTGSEYNSDHTIQFNVGRGPVEAEVIEADLELTTDIEHLRIWAINPAGFPSGQVQVTWAEGKAKFTIGGAFPSLYYLIQQA